MYYQARIGTGSWISLATLGASNLRRTLVLCGVDTFEFDVTSALALTEDNSFTYNALVSIRRQTTDSLVAATDQWYFRGRVRSVPRSGQGQSEQYHVRIEGPWSWFDKTLYRQSWAESAGAISKPRAVLFMAANGTRLATGLQMKAIADVAIASGAPCTVENITGGITPAYDEQTNITCAQALLKALSYHPHGAVWFDYSTEVPVLKYGQRTALTAASISVLGKAGLSIAQRTDLQVPAIAIYYEKQNTVDGASVPETTRDLFPANADPYGADVLSAVFDLRGNTVATVSQYIKAEQFPLNYDSLDWWKARVPRLNDYTSVTISNGGRLGDTNLAHILVEGEKAPWMNQSFAKERIQCDALCVMQDGNGNIVDKHTETVTLEVMATGCPNGETVYRALASFDPGEDIPVGIAEALYTEWSQLHFEGSLTITEDEPTGQALPGKRLNLTDGRAEWATMSALVCRASEDIDNGTTSIDFGPPSWTDIDARVAFERAARNRQYAQSRALISGSSTATGVQGPTGAAEIRDGSTNSHLNINRFQDIADAAKLIILDPALISPAAVATGSKEVKPRLMQIPQLDANGNLTFQQAVILGAAIAGDVTTPAIAKDSPQVPSSYASVPTFWGEFSGASGGGTTPSTSAWVAKGQAGHTSGQGVACLFLERIYLDNSAATPNLVGVQRRALVAEDGRILAISSPFEFVISPTVAV
jgi:hypothetical protein